jgi:hypothetical protein
MITAPSNSHVFFVIEGLLSPSLQQFQCRPFTRLINPCIEDVYEGNCPVLLQTMRLLCSMTPLRVRWCQTFRPPKVRFEL